MSRLKVGNRIPLSRIQSVHTLTALYTSYPLEITKSNPLGFSLTLYAICHNEITQASPLFIKDRGDFYKEQKINGNR